MSIPTLKKACEIALARELAKVPGLRNIVPKVWDSDAPVRQPFLNIQATPAGEEEVYRHGVYWVDCQVRVEGKPRRGYTVAAYIALVDQVFAELASLDKSGLEARFAQTGIYVLGVKPRQFPATIEGDNRVDMAGVSLLAFLCPPGSLG